MSRKSKGISAERDLVHLFWKNGWAAIRVAGSGNMQFPCPDLLAGNGQRILAIECKAAKEASRHFERGEISQLQEFSQLFGAEPWVGMRVDRDRWYFFTLDSLKKTANNFSITAGHARLHGILLDELLKG